MLNFARFLLYLSSSNRDSRVYVHLFNRAPSKFKLKEINPDIKILLSSGYGINSQATEILNCGCNDFIQKPFDIKTLSKKIRNILDQE
jgi:CheY-like chemotaxis protein